MEMYRAVQQQDIDNFIRFLGPAMSYPPAFSTPGYAAPGMPQGYPQPPTHPSNPTHMQPDPQLGTPPPQPVTRDLPTASGSQQQQQQAQQMNSTSADVRSNIVPFRKAQSLGNPNQPGGITGGFVDEDTGQDTRPILLFDLNGTLTSHTAAKRSAGRSLMRPGIHHLRRLQVRSKSLLMHPYMQISKIGMMHSFVTHKVLTSGAPTLMVRTICLEGRDCHCIHLVHAGKLRIVVVTSHRVHRLLCQFYVSAAIHVVWHVYVVSYTSCSCNSSPPDMIDAGLLSFLKPGCTLKLELSQGSACGMCMVL